MSKLFPALNRASIFLFTLLLAIAAIGADQSYVPELIRYEQTMNDKVENRQYFNTIKDATLADPYLPESQQFFPLGYILVPIDEAVLVSSLEAPPKGLTVTRDGQQFVKFFIHPQSENFFQAQIDKYGLHSRYSATPMASYRSLIVRDDEAKDNAKFLNLKVSLDSIIGSNSRLLSRSQIERATAVSMIIKNMDKEALARKGIIFIDEPFSVYLKDQPFGYSFRELPRLAANVEMIPLFSLYSKKSGQDSILSKMITESDQSSKDFVREKLLVPITEHLIELALSEGIIGELHEQNMLAERKNGKLTGRFFYRDLAGFRIDPNLRTAVGKDLKFIPKSFDLSKFKFGSADVVNQILWYLVNANFFALRKSVSGLSKEWVEAETLAIARNKIFEMTGRTAATWIGLKRAVTEYQKTGPQYFCQFIH